MSEAHLANGSEKPPKKEGVLRLYSMLYCPFAERARLVLKAKNLPHDIVNINLQSKPDWFLELNPAGKVPALDTGSRIVTESLDICDFLEEQYPKPPLYPADPTALQKDKELIKSFDTLTSKLVEVWFNKNNRTLLEHVRDAVPELQRLENELINRGTFFGGDVPGMADYMLWPWAERATTFPLLYKEEFPLPDDSFQKLRAWFKAMQKVKVIQETQISPETFYKLVLKFKGGQKIAYDEL